MKTTSGSVTDYCGNFIYADNQLITIFAGDVRVAPVNVGNNTYWKYEYSMKDHLGNVRVVFAAHSHGQPGLLQQTSYYPFGMTLQQQNFYSQNATENKYLYNGKELQNDQLAGNTLDWYDYGARFYDATLGRWHVVDPLAEKYYSISPYAYVANNPIIRIDPDGRDIVIILNRDNRGNVSETVRFENGNLYTQDGELYEGDNEFALTIKTTLNNLLDLNDKVVSSVISDLETSENTHWIEKDPYNADRVYASPNYIAADKGEPSDSHMLVTLAETPIENNLKTTKESTLGHELKHSWDYDKGNMKGETFRYKTNKTPSEIRAVNFENRIRYRQKIETRSTYGKKPIDPNKLKDPSK